VPQQGTDRERIIRLETTQRFNATKHDLAVLEISIVKSFSALKEELKSDSAELKSGLAELREEFKSDSAELKTGLAKATTVTYWFMPCFLAMLGLFAGLFYFTSARFDNVNAQTSEIRGDLRSLTEIVTRLVESQTSSPDSRRQPAAAATATPGFNAPGPPPEQSAAPGPSDASTGSAAPGDGNGN
jgi:hypothetical protein